MGYLITAFVDPYAESHFYKAVLYYTVPCFLHDTPSSKPQPPFFLLLSLSLCFLPHSNQSSRLDTNLIQYCNCQVPFAIRNQDNRGIVYTTKPLNRATNYRIKVRAQGYRPNGQLEYQTTFVLFISVSAYTYQ